MQAERDLSRLNLFRIRGTVMCCRYGFTMIGIRESLFCALHFYFIDHANSYRDELMEECVKLMQQSLGANSTFVKKRAKSVYSQRNLGTIRERKKERKQEKEVAGSEEIILRILRMRYVSERVVDVACAEHLNITDRGRPTSSPSRYGL